MAKVPDIHVHVHVSDEEDLRTIRRLRRRVELLEQSNRDKDAWIEEALALDVTQTGEINELRATVAARDADIAEAIKAADAFDLDPNNPPATTSGESNGPQPTQ